MVSSLSTSCQTWCLRVALAGPVTSDQQVDPLIWSCGGNHPMQRRNTVSVAWRLQISDVLFQGFKNIFYFIPRPLHLRSIIDIRSPTCLLVLSLSVPKSTGTHVLDLGQFKQAADEMAWNCLELSKLTANNSGQSLFNMLPYSRAVQGDPREHSSNRDNCQLRKGLSNRGALCQQQDGLYLL